MFVKNAKINGGKVNCLIDTGSRCTLIKENVAKRLQVKTEIASEKHLKCFMGNIVSSCITAQITIKIEGVSARIEAIVLDESCLNYDLIVGTDFLTQEHVGINKTQNRLTLYTLPKLTQETLSVNLIEFEASDKLDYNKIHFGEITNEQKLLLFNLLKEYESCISSSFLDLGRTNAVEMHIRLMNDNTIVYRPYRVYYAEKSILQNMINELFKSKIIRPSESPYASPVLLVKKKTGDYRMAVDFRKVNAITVKDKYPLPLIEEQIDRLGNNKYFIGLDLASGYYQVPMAEESIEKTAVVTPDAHFEFLRMPFGLSNAPAVFQRLMNNVLGELKNTKAFPYIDDIIIPSVTFSEGIDTLRQVLEKFKMNNLTLKLSKCYFFQTEIDYLGREISSEGVRPGTKKMEAVLNMPDPSNVKQVRQFLGLAGYFRKFMMGYASLAEPLTRLLKKEVKWFWGDKQTEAVQSIKRALVSKPLLAIFDPELTIELHTDASSVGVGGILLQKKGGETRVVGY